MLLANAVVSTLINLLILAGIPFLVYFAYNKWRRKREFTMIARQAGLQLGGVRYVGYGLILAFVSVLVIAIWPPPLAPLIRLGSPQRPFVGLGLRGISVTMALLYGVFQTGFPEELLFRGLIAGSLSRRFPFIWANLAQALIFLLPHLLILRVMPEMWPILPSVFAAALFQGWLRIRSGSIMGPWLFHAFANVAICLSVAIRSAT
jgi:membrane protease YdiL (CAAX protease family)